MRNYLEEVKAFMKFIKIVMKLWSESGVDLNIDTKGLTPENGKLISE